MTYDAFTLLCQREWDNGFGEVKELHLDAEAYRELADTTPHLPPGVTDFAQLVHMTTGVMVDIIRHRNHATVVRPPQPPPTTHTVNV